MSLTFKTFDETLRDLKARIAENPHVSEMDTSEGSFVDGVLRAAAYELTAASFEQQALLAVVFPDETSGRYIDDHAADLGIYRKTGAKAVAEVTFAGTDGTVVPAGTAVQTQNGLVFVTNETATISSGTAVVGVTAVGAGMQYNVEENAIVCLQSRGNVTVAGSTAATGGTDPESDASLLARLQAYRLEAPASGNAAQYRAWAMEVPGVGGAKVLERWSGAGTVKIVLADADGLPVSDELEQQVQEYVDARREVCVDVACTAAEAVDVEIAATVVKEDAVSAESVQAAFQCLVADYFRTVALQSQTVVYNRIAALLLTVPGVTDFTELTVNGGTANIPLAEDAVPVLQEVAVS